MQKNESTCSIKSGIPLFIIILYILLHIVLLIFLFFEAKHQRRRNEMKINEQNNSISSNNKDRKSLVNGTSDDMKDTSHEYETKTGTDITKFKANEIEINEMDHTIGGFVDCSSITKNKKSLNSNKPNHYRAPSLVRTKSVSQETNLWKIFISIYSIYLPLVTHLFDQASDIAVVAQFILIWKADVDCVNEITGDTMKVFQFVIVSMLCLIAYRIMSSIWIYTISKRFMRVLFQFFDLEIFRAIYITSELKISEKTEPQKIIDLFEATLEATPQLILQATFILMTGNFGDFVILFSIIFSFIVITFKLKSNDAKIFRAIGYGFEFDINNICSFNNMVYIIRILFRWFNITSSLLLYSLMHTLGYGYNEIIMVSVNVVIHLGLAIVFRELVPYISVIYRYIYIYTH